MKKIAFFVTMTVFHSMALAQYNVNSFSLELQAIKTQIDQKKINQLVVPGAPAPAVAPDTLSSDQPATISRQIAACQQTMDRMATLAEKKTNRSVNWALAGAITGLLGSVGAGHVSSIVIGLLSGTAGLANTAQQVYKDAGDTPQATLTTRSGIRTQAISAIDEYTKAVSDEGRYNAMIKLHFACAMYEMTCEGKLPVISTK